MLETWTLDVLTLMNRALAISRLVWPASDEIEDVDF